MTTRTTTTAEDDEDDDSSDDLSDDESSSDSEELDEESEEQKRQAAERYNRFRDTKRKREGSERQVARQTAEKKVKGGKGEEELRNEMEATVKDEFLAENNRRKIRLCYEFFFDREVLLGVEASIKMAGKRHSLVPYRWRA